MAQQPAPARPVFLPPATPSELLDRLLAHHAHPTALLVCSPRQPFLDALAQDVRRQLPPPPPRAGPDAPQHPLLRPPPLEQVAVSRRLRVAFVPTVAHLRAYLAAFAAAAAPSPPPPPRRRPPLLLVYGLVELHRDGAEWSAQGLGASAAALVESAARNALTAAVAEPRRTGRPDELRAALGETVPLLGAGVAGRDGAWAARPVELRSVFARWFELESPRGVGDGTPEE